MREVAHDIVILLIDAQAVHGTADVRTRHILGMLIRVTDALQLREVYGIVVPVGVRAIAIQIIVVHPDLGLVVEPHQVAPGTLGIIHAAGGI